MWKYRFFVCQSHRPFYNLKGIRFDEGNPNIPIASDHFYDNGAYMNIDDEPPNYYEAVLIKNRAPNLVINKTNPTGTVIELSEINLHSLMNESSVPAADENSRPSSSLTLRDG